MKKSLARILTSLALALTLLVGGLSLFPAAAGAAGTDPLTLSGTPVTSATGNSYDVVLDATSIVPPIGSATLTDSDANSCTTTGWTDAGSDGSGGELFDASCSITAPEAAPATVQATYSGLDYGSLTSNTLTISPVPGTLAISGSPVTSATGNTYTLTADVPTDLAPGYGALVLDSESGGCSGSSWTGAGPDTSGGEYFTSTCIISTAESAGASVSASYSGPDYTLSGSSTIYVAAAPASLSLQGTPAQSSSGNTFSVVLDAPTDLTPTGTATVTDSNSNACATSSWTDEGTDGGSGELFSATCAITAPENAGDTVIAAYSGTDYTTGATNTLTVGSASASLGLNGTPTQSATGNDYSVMLDAPSNTAPTGTATITDSGANSCTTSSWVDSGTDGAGGEIFAANCAISAPETGGETVQATYTGADYTTSASNPLTVASGTASLTLSGTPVTSATGNTYQVQIDTSTDISPVNAATVTDSSSNSCTTSSWTDAGSDGSGGELLTSNCTITEAEAAPDTAQATYTGPDYTAAASNTLTLSPVSGTLTLSGSPATSATGNTYTLTADVPTDLAPGYGALVLDSGGGGCSGSSWTDAGSDGSGGELFTSTCQDTAPESGGETASASYFGPDYTLSTSNTITISSVPVTLNVTGNPVTSETGNAYTVTMDSPTDIVPSGTATITDSSSNFCTSTTWSDSGSDGSGGELFTANCAITAPEDAGVAVLPSYTGPDYTVSSTNELFVEAASATLALSGAPVQSSSGNTYTVTLDAPSDLAPTGTATVTDSNSNFCTTSSWTAAGTDGAGGEFFSANCSITAPETSGQTVSAYYSGSDYTTATSNTLSVGAVAATLSLAGSPVTSASGNSFIATLNTPSDIAPTGTVTITDSGSNSCTSSLWSDEGTNGSGGELFSASCSITAPESGGATLSATYAGADYSTSSSNTLTVSAVAATLHLAGSPLAGSGNVYHVTLNSPTDVTPTGVATVTDSNSNSCTASSWSDEGTNGSGGELFSASCTITSSETAASTLSVTYAGPDYTISSPSNTLTVDAAPGITGVSISGTAVVGDVLSAVLSGVSGTPSPSVSYQWKDNGFNISGAIYQTYTVASTDAGDTITVTAVESNGVGTPASATSLPTAAVTTTGGGGGGGGGGSGTTTTTTPTTPPPTTTTTTTPTHGTGDSVKVVANKVTTLDVVYNGATFVITVPKNALPAATVITFVPVTISALSAKAPAGTTVVVPIDITWKTKTGASPLSSAPVSLHVTDPAIGAKDVLYIVASSGASLVKATISKGSASFSFVRAAQFLITTPKPAPPKTKTVTLSLGFAANSATLNTADRNALNSLAKQLTKGEVVIATGYANGNLTLARLRVEVVAKYLDARIKVSESLYYVKTAGSKTVVTATIK